MHRSVPDVKSVFGKALEIPLSADRALFLDEACADAPEVRAQVQGLLDALGKAGSFMRSPAAPALQTEDYETPITEGNGTVIGPYTLREQIGEGGFGLVFVAEQQQPVRRKVALKVIKPGMDTRTVVARFEAERQALALMEHPNIARVLDAGATDTGRPYFVMELVKGMPITEYADANNLTPRERLGLFVQVCQAVQHAHQKGVIHRDLKPSNILVAPHDGVPVVKVIDFGVAKALGQQLTEKTIYTRFAAMIGTPLYMSPEQAEVNQLDVDTRSDIYSLGVLLYELLTGTTPFDSSRFKKAAFDEIRRIILEEEPPRPSTRLTSLGETLTLAAAKRGTEPGKLAGLVRGELDWIVMKCLEKERGRRYESAAGLAKDIQRFLNGDTVEACPPTLGYRLQKLYLKNRGPILTAASFAALLVIGITASIMLALQATRSQRQAESAQKDAQAKEQEAQAALVREAEQRVNAESASADTKTALAILSSVLEELNPYWRPGQAPPTVQEALVKACDRLEKQTSLSPTVRAGVRNVFGQMFLTLHLYGEARKQFKLAYDELAKPDVKGPLDPDALHSLEQYGQSLVEGRSRLEDLKEAEKTFRIVYDARKRTLSAGHPDTLKTLSKSLTEALFYQMEFPRAKECLQEALAAALANSLLGEDHEITAQLQLRLANMLARTPDTRDRDEARRLCESAIRTLTQIHGPNHPVTLSAKMWLPLVNDETGDPAEKPSQLYELVKLMTQTAGTADNDLLLRAYDNLALSSLIAGKPELADEATARLLELGPVIHGKGHPLMRRYYAFRAGYLMQAGRYREAEKDARTTLYSPEFDDLKHLIGEWDAFPLTLAHVVLAKCILQEPKLTENDFQQAEKHLIMDPDPVRNAPKRLGPINRREKLLLSHGLRVWIELYDKWGKPEKAKAKRIELEQLLK